MANNKHALIRYRALDACFRNRRVKYAFKDLHEAVNRRLEDYDPTTKGISRAMLYDDISFMESTDGWRAEIERIKEGRTVYLRYADPDFSINNMPLNQLEISQLKEAMLVVSQFQGLPQFGWVEEVAAKIDQDIRTVQAAPIISFDANQYLKGIEYLGTFYNAILYKKAQHISYKHFRSITSEDFIFHPYHLKQYNNRWFAFGNRIGTDRAIDTIALDRIDEITLSSAEYIPNLDIDFNSYFEDIIGVTRPDDGKLVNVQLRVHRDRSGYVKTKPLHGSQKDKFNPDGSLDVHLELIPNPELIQVLLSFGSSIEVLSPRDLRDQFQKEAAYMFKLYDSLVSISE
jgi:predicted DNA-binding transcriptional regulator YafY